MIDFKLVVFGLVCIAIFIFGVRSSGSASCVLESDCLGVGLLGFNAQGAVLNV